MVIIRDNECVVNSCKVYEKQFSMNPLRLYGRTNRFLDVGPFVWVTFRDKFYCIWYGTIFNTLMAAPLIRLSLISFGFPIDWCFLAVLKLFFAAMKCNWKIFVSLSQVKNEKKWGSASTIVQVDSYLYPFCSCTVGIRRKDSLIKCHNALSLYP